MAEKSLGQFRSGKGNSYEVKWDAESKEVQVSYQGWAYIGKAPTEEEARTKSMGWLFNK